MSGEDSTDRDARIAAAQEKRRRKNAADKPLSDDAPRSGMRFLFDEAAPDGSTPEVWSEVGLVLRETDQQGVWTINEPNRVMRWIRYDPGRGAWARSSIPLLPVPAADPTPNPYPSSLDDDDDDALMAAILGQTADDDERDERDEHGQYVAPF